MNYTEPVFFLHALPYGDSSLIISGFSENRGRIDLMAKGIKKAKSKKLSFMRPMLHQDWTYSQKDPEKLGILKDVHSNNSELSTDPQQINQFMFLAELLHKTLNKNEEQASLYNFTSYLISRAIAGYEPNTHVVFLTEYIKHLGYTPDLSTYREGYQLDLIEGKFSATAIKSLNSNLSSKLFKLLGTDFDTAMSVTFAKGERTLLISQLVAYLQYHIEGFPELKTLEVFTSLYRS